MEDGITKVVFLKNYQQIKIVMSDSLYIMEDFIESL